MLAIIVKVVAEDTLPRFIRDIISTLTKVKNEAIVAMLSLMTVTISVIYLKLSMLYGLIVITVYSVALIIVMCISYNRSGKKDIIQVEVERMRSLGTDVVRKTLIADIFPNEAILVAKGVGYISDINSDLLRKFLEVLDKLGIFTLDELKNILLENDVIAIIISAQEGLFQGREHLYEIFNDFS